MGADHNLGSGAEIDGQPFVTSVEVMQIFSCSNF
jgi:hypothetical protein